MYERIVEMICDQFDMDASEISEDTAFVDDLGIDSLDVVELIMEVENEFGLPEIPEEELKKMATVHDLVEYVSAHAE